MEVGEEVKGKGKQSCSLSICIMQKNWEENPDCPDTTSYGHRPLTLGFLHKNHFGIGAEVLSGQDHLLASQNRAVLRVLLLHHGKLVRRPLSCRGDKDRRSTGYLGGRHSGSRTDENRGPNKQQKQQVASVLLEQNI